MSFLLTKEQIRALYDVNGKGEVVAYGRNVTNIVKNPARRKLTLDDFGSNAYDEHYDRLWKTPSKPAQREVVVESEVQEIF